MLLESTSGELVKRALPGADQQGEVMMVLNEKRRGRRELSAPARRPDVVRHVRVSSFAKPVNA